MFKTKAEKTAHGSWNVESTCPKGHTSYRKQGTGGTYECPYCGLDVR